MKLPDEFLNKMLNLLGREEFDRFLKSYNDPRYYGLRVNTLKVDIDEFLRLSPFGLEPVPWTRDGFYYKEGQSPGKHPYYHAGLYYIQEPSAMLPGEVIDARPGEHILDLCAAPGGKTVQIAAGMKGKGILVANDISSDRVKALVKNIELCGVTNAIVTNDTPEKLARNFRGYFDKILVDAPCSGEGMFRKDEEAARSWENFKCEKCSCMQWDILEHLDEMLKPGGILVYSTCTFSPEEDEQMIARFLDRHGGYEVIAIPRTGGIAAGRPEWGFERPDLANTVRLWPHNLKGEGHFTAKLRKPEGISNIKQENAFSWFSKDSAKEATSSVSKYKQEQGSRKNKKGPAANPFPTPAEAVQALEKFSQENLNISIDGFFTVKGNNLYCLPEIPPNLDGIKVAKFGWYLGEILRGRLEPSHSFVLSLKSNDIKNILNYSSDSREISRYLKGETLEAEGKGIAAVCADGFILGWGKISGGMLKNFYPKGWRRMN